MFLLRLVTATVLGFTVLSAAPAARALEEGRLRDIERADNVEELADLAREITGDLAERQPADAQERTAIAAEAAVYLQYLRLRQQQFLYRMLDSRLGRLGEQDPLPF